MSEELQKPLIKVFLEETQELLEELERSLLEMEESPGDADLVGKVFRALHTIKGNGAMFGFHRVSEFSHELESAFALVREGELAASHDLIDLTLQARDRIASMIAEGPEADQELTPGDHGLLERLHDISAPAPPEREQVPPAAAGGGEGCEAAYRIRWKPRADLFASGTNPATVLGELQSLGECVVVAHLEGIPPLGEIDPQGCYVYWDIILTTDKGADAVREAFLFVEGRSDLTIEEVDNRCLPSDGGAVKRLGEILVEKGDLPPGSLSDEPDGRKRIGERLVEQGLLHPRKVDAALAEQAAVRELRHRSAQDEAAGTIRVDSGKLDDLVNLVGELVTVQARLSRTAADLGDPGLATIAEDVERLTGELRDNTFNIRMVPIGTTFTKFRRLVRDLAREMGKEADLVTRGGETELDKTVIEKLNEPLVHVIRNALDHGLEPPDAREAGGKPRRGTVELSAAHAGASVLIKVRDDGRGLDLDAIRAHAVSKGVISPDAPLADRDIAALVFAPGFSTAREITRLSGRGVGLDVVKRFVEALRGSVEIDSAPGGGTVVSIRLPLTLAIIQGLQVRVGTDHFILPLSVVEECVEIVAADREAAHGKPLATVRGDLVPYVRMREVFSIPGDPPAREQVVIADLEGRRVGFAVDSVVGEHQTVIKSLGKVFRGSRGVSGATILGDGSVALILEGPELVKIAEAEEARLIR